MDSVVTLLAAPGLASSAMGAIEHTVAGAARPFAAVLDALMAEPDAGADRHVDATALTNRLAERLQNLLAAAGVEPGQFCTVCYDPPSGHVDVDHGSPLAADAGAMIEADDQLMADLQALAERNGDDDRLELLIETA